MIPNRVSILEVALNLGERVLAIAACLMKRVKQRLFVLFALSGSRNPPNEEALKVRNAALHVANYHLEAGRSVEVAVADAITHIRLRTRDWNDEPGLRRWLKSQLSTHLKARPSELKPPGDTRASDVSIMKTNDWKRDIAIAAVGILVGFGIGWVARSAVRSDRYSLHTLGPPLSHVRAIKLDKRTGDTWVMDLYGRWTNGVPTY
jgi:hypothetical protein